MLNIRDLTIHAKAVAEVVKSTIAEALSPIEKRLEVIESFPNAEQIKSDILAEVEALIPEVKNGDPGEKGDPGKDADPEEIKQLIAAAVAEIPPAKDGEPGASVTLEDVAPMIDQAVKSAMPDLSNFIHVDQVEKMVSDAVSRSLESIEMPKNGENGRDALDIEILPAIDESKNYPRGTYASHNGGLWKSYQMTVGMKGWECIVDGVAEVEVKHNDKDPRVIFLGIKKSSGALSHEHITIPAVIDKGIYNPESIYEKGDGVTWAGSYWIANDEPDCKPGTGEGWRLAVKKGRDGKDGINGIDKAPRVAK